MYLEHLICDPLFACQRQTNLRDLLVLHPPILASKSSDEHVLVRFAEQGECLSDSSNDLWTVVAEVVHIGVGVVADVGLCGASAVRSDEHSAILLALGSVSSAYHLQDGTRVELVTSIKDESI